MGKCYLKPIEQTQYVFVNGLSKLKAKACSPLLVGINGFSDANAVNCHKNKRSTSLYNLTKFNATF